MKESEVRNLFKSVQNHKRMWQFTCATMYCYFFTEHTLKKEYNNTVKVIKEYISYIHKGIHQTGAQPFLHRIAKNSTALQRGWVNNPKWRADRCHSHWYSNTQSHLLSIPTKKHWLGNSCLFKSGCTTLAKLNLSHWKDSALLRPLS